MVVLGDRRARTRWYDRGKEQPVAPDVVFGPLPGGGRKPGRVVRFCAGELAQHLVVQTANGPRPALAVACGNALVISRVDELPDVAPGRGAAHTSSRVVIV